MVQVGPAEWRDDDFAFRARVVDSKYDDRAGEGCSRRMYGCEVTRGDYSHLIWFLAKQTAIKRAGQVVAAVVGETCVSGVLQ